MIRSVLKIKISQLILNQFLRKTNIAWFAQCVASKNNIYCHYIELISISTVVTLSWNRPETEKLNWLYQTILCTLGLVNCKLKVILLFMKKRKIWTESSVILIKILQLILNQFMRKKNIAWFDHWDTLKYRLHIVIILSMFLYPQWSLCLEIVQKLRNEIDYIRLFFVLWVLSMANWKWPSFAFLIICVSQKWTW